MIEEHITVGLAVERRDIGGRWGGIAWRPIAILPELPDAAPWTKLGETADTIRFYAGEALIRLYSTDTANYRDNLASGAPKLWVVLRSGDDLDRVEVLNVTADPAEGEASTEAGNDTVETIDMPAGVAGIIAAFVDRHHVERPHYKRQRDGKRGGKGRGSE